MPAYGIDEAEKFSVIFSAVFADLYREHVLADNGADGRFLEVITLCRVSASGADIGVQGLAQSPDIDMAGAASDRKLATIIEWKEISMNMARCRRYGFALSSATLCGQ